MAVALRFDLDTRQLQAWGAQTTRQLKSNLRGVVDRSARYARRETLPVLVADSGVPLASFKAAVPLVKGTTTSSLSATWAIGKAANNIRLAGSSAIPSPKRNEAVTVSTFRQTGGGSESLTITKGFTITANGGKAFMIRIGKGRNAIRKVFAENPSTGMLQADGAPRVVWERAAETSMSLLTARAVQSALDGQAVKTPLSTSDAP